MLVHARGLRSPARAFSWTGSLRAAGEAFIGSDPLKAPAVSSGGVAAKGLMALSNFPGTLRRLRGPSALSDLAKNPPGGAGLAWTGSCKKSCGGLGIGIKKDESKTGRGALVWAAGGLTAASCAIAELAMNHATSSTVRQQFTSDSRPKAPGVSSALRGRRFFRRFLPPATFNL
jgi:hypothetical protein